jgi:hypothetical protein
MTPSEVYFDLALKVIPLARTAGDLRAWWETERRRREDYLTTEQIHELVYACRDHVQRLEEDDMDRPEEQQQRRRPAPRRRAAI